MYRFFSPAFRLQFLYAAFQRRLCGIVGDITQPGFRYIRPVFRDTNDSMIIIKSQHKNSATGIAMIFLFSSRQESSPRLIRFIDSTEIFSNN
jgi:hypothetical protein